MRLCIKRTFVISLAILWALLSVLTLRFVDNTLVKVISVILLLVYSITMIIFGYLTIKDSYQANKVLNALS